MASISDTGNVKSVFNPDPCVMKHLWCDIVDSSLTSFFKACQITYWCPVDLHLNKLPEKKKLSGVRYSDLADHVIYGDTFPIHLAENCSSKNLRIMLTKCGRAPPCW